MRASLVQVFSDLMHKKENPYLKIKYGFIFLLQRIDVILGVDSLSVDVDLEVTVVTR